MIIWGGYQITSPSHANTGGRYDPSTDSWQPTSTTGDVASPRDKHSAVWTGEEMLVWGGSHLSRDLDTGARYDPVSDTWGPSSASNGRPPRRDNHLAVWTGADDQRMIVWGGSPPTATGGLYCTAECLAPGPATSLGFLDHETLQWPVQPGANAYDVVKGDLTALRTGSGDFSGSILDCLDNDGTDGQAEDTERPPNGEGYYYLYRSIGCEGIWGTYDTGSAGQQGSRDSGINASADACP
jgi:hypothetical protein